MALLTSLLLFVYFWLLGFSLLSLFKLEINDRQQHLISPTLGFSIITLLVYLINKFGIPVDDFSFYLTILISLFIIIVVLYTKPKLCIDITKGASLILLFASLLIGYPMLIYGFDWISYANDDMANYVLAAQRLQENSFFSSPDFENLINGGDRTHHFWFMHAVMGHRVGSEVLLAYASSLTGLNAHQTFMP